MEFLREISDRFSVSIAPPDVEDLEQFAVSGYSAVVDLQGQDEPERALTAERERDVAVRCGMNYRHIPIAGASLTDAAVDAFRESVADLPGRILVHGGNERSAAFTLMHVASEKGLSGNDAIKQGRDLGFDWANNGLDEFVQHYVDSHSVDFHYV